MTDDANYTSNNEVRIKEGRHSKMEKSNLEQC